MTTLEQRYECETCRTAFASKAQLREHGTTHRRAPGNGRVMPSTAPTFKCGQCDATFDSEYRMAEHSKQAHLF